MTHVTPNTEAGWEALVTLRETHYLGVRWSEDRKGLCGAPDVPAKMPRGCRGRASCVVCRDLWVQGIYGLAGGA